MMRSLVVVPGLLVLLCSFAGAQEEKPGKQTVFQFPHIQVDRSKADDPLVRVEAELSPALTGQFSVLEFLLIGGMQHAETGEWIYDRDYESVFVTKASPSVLQAALFLAGFLPGPLPEQAPEGFSKDNAERLTGPSVEEEAKKAPGAAMLSVTVEWQEDGQTRSAPVEAFLYDRERQGTARPSPFAFTGSFFVTDENGRKMLAADQTFVIISVFHDASALLNLPYYAGNAHWGGDAGFELRADALPEFFRKPKVIVEGTTKRTIQIPQPHPVTLVIRRAPAAAASAQPTP